MIGAAYLALRDTIRRLYALDWERPTQWPEIEISAELNLHDKYFGCRSILLGTPRSGKTEALKRCSDTHYIDLITFPSWKINELTAAVDEVIVIDHFEHNWYSSAYRRRKLEILERLIYEVRCRVVVSSTIDPLYYFDRLARRKGSPTDEDADALDIDRWTRALASFHIVRAKSRNSIEHQQQYFAVLWWTCSGEERATLHQIARHGWVNYLQGPALTHLHQRGLIVRDRKFDITDPNFADYIRHLAGEEQFAVAGDDGTGEALSALRVAIVVAGIVFIAVLAYIWGDQMVAYVATGASAVTAASRAFAKPKTRANLGSEET